MTQKLTQEQLTQIIAEVQALQIRQEGEFDRHQIQEILQELNLPPELLDEALIQLNRKQALQVQQRRNRLIFAGVATVFVVAIASIIFSHQQYNSTLSRVSAQQDRITLVNDSGNLKNILRQTNPELFYRVTLQDAPVGEKLSLSCNWIDPSGQVVKQNKYQTREIKTSVWDTYCRYTINSAAPVGDWQVQIFLEGRQISEEKFRVQ